MHLCNRCKEREAEFRVSYSGEWMCRNCFTAFLERKVARLVLKRKMIDEDRLSIIAVSGGKDSAALASILKRTFPSVKFLCVYLNLGIPNFSDECEAKARELCQKLGLSLRVVSLEKEYGFSILDLKKSVYGRKICSACGVVKRYLLNKVAIEEGAYSVLTGHNLDDIVEVLFDHYLNGRVRDIVRTVEFSPPQGMLAGRGKPLARITNEELLFYAKSMELPFSDAMCVYALKSRSYKRKKLMKILEKEIKGFRHIYYGSHRRIRRVLEKGVEEKKGKVVNCLVCKLPTTSKKGICGFCRIVDAGRKARANTY